MRNQFMLLILLSLTTHSTLGQAEKSLLIQFIDSSKNTVNFNNLGEFRYYKNTREDDLYRKTYSENIILASQQQNSVSGYLPAEILTIDSVDFNFSGENEITPLGNKNIIVENDTVLGCRLLRVKENYIAKKWLDTVANYSNTYYSFVKNGATILEVFYKQRILSNILHQDFEGISINTVGEVPAIQLVLTPNPASTTCEVQFDLCQSGFCYLHIVNQSLSESHELFSGSLGSGIQSISFPADGLVAGTYTVFLQFDNTTYSANLIIQ